MPQSGSDFETTGEERMLVTVRDIVTPCVEDLMEMAEENITPQLPPWPDTLADAVSYVCDRRMVESCEESEWLEDGELYRSNGKRVL